MKAPSSNTRLPFSSVANNPLDIELRRCVLLVTAIVLACTLATIMTTTLLVDRNMRRITEQDLQERTASLARSVDLKLRTYKVALETIAESYSLREKFDLTSVEWEARRVGELFDGWFVLARGGDVMEFIMSTVTEDGSLPPSEPRTNYPEVMRAETESIRTGQATVSDAFIGTITGEVVVAITKPINTLALPDHFINFAVTLRDITAWLEAANLDKDEFASIADGAGRLIARSKDNQDFVLAELPDWYRAFREGRDNGVAVGPQVNDGVGRLFATQRLEVAPGWTLAMSHPLPLPFSATYLSPWPAISGIVALLFGGSIAGLYLSRVRGARKLAFSEVQLSEAHEADARKARLMAVLAHDLRTPLIAMLGTLDLFREDVEKSAHDRMLHRLKTEGHGMLHLIDDVLELARLGSGEARLRPEPFSAKDLLRQIGDLVQPPADRHETEVVVQVDDLPMLTGDVMSLRRVLLNFATNAVKATRGGSVRLSATRGADAADGHTVTFAVTDTGYGIAPEDIPRLFRDFGMLERDGLTRDGTGLGLAICRRLATAMGGEVGVESTLGVGSRFWLRVTLPEAESEGSAPDHLEQNPFAVLAGLRVLVAEDHEIIRQLTCANLTRCGMLPAEASDGIIAVELAAAEKFDIILMDLQMPRLDGDEAAARIRKGSGLSAKAWIICVTAHQAPEIAVMLSDLAFDACLRKPLDLQQLAALVRGDMQPSPTPTLLDDFDTDNLMTLREVDGGPLLNRTLKQFADEIESTRIELAALMNKRNTFEAGRLVHKLTGFGDLLGARTLSAELRKFEDLIHDEEIKTLEGALKRIDDVMTKTRMQVNSLIEEVDRDTSGKETGADHVS